MTEQPSLREQRLISALRELVCQIDSGVRDELGHPLVNNVAYLNAVNLLEEIDGPGGL